MSQKLNNSYLAFESQVRHWPFRQAGTLPDEFQLQSIAIYTYTALQGS